MVNGFVPDLIAMSVTEDMYPIGIMLVSALGATRPKVVAGGVFPTFAPDLTLRYANGSIDYVLKGEGDETLAEFFRKQRIDLVRNELRHCAECYKADSFYFWADTFLAWNDIEFEEFCEMYSEFKLPFWIQTRPETVRADRFRKLKKIGLLRVAFGVEHGNEQFRKRVLNRSVKNDKIIQNLKFPFICSGLAVYLPSLIKFQHSRQVYLAKFFMRLFSKAAF